MIYTAYINIYLFVYSSLTRDHTQARVPSVVEIATAPNALIYFKIALILIVKFEKLIQT